MSFSDISHQKRSFNNNRNGNSNNNYNNNNNNNDNITQLSDSLQQFQKYCVVLKEKVTEFRRRKCNQYEKNDIDMQIKELRNFESRLKTSIDSQLKALEAARNPENAQKRIALGKLQKDFERVKVNVQSLLSESALIKIALDNNSNNYNNNNNDINDELNNSRTVFQEPFVIHNTMQGQEVDDAIMAERERDIKKMNQDLLLVNEMFRDMAQIVDKQGGQIEEIEKTTESSHERAKAGLEQVRQAANHQSSCSIS